ncbi:4-hydroxybenzoate polyprenyltransferase [Streptosporangium becharense]|uniref:4-hydroxybenzoate polyprenyltransferase n=1 Tax=Streptosporangium becharense TaxID=1816182 RepID=A0A7W9ICB9_9ACTN|nr:UbiA family prenyltransferase [Streptosporangium becharense]MBB2915276.1 4-hydroxybenzoate polyprenyltransferase [Streptosporangium becharense]MBB5817895.1 4-hydroxybenzoate polyprenyltransferase [Streptosporangium becharense]
MTRSGHPSPATGTALRAARGLLLACHPGPTAAVTALVTALAVASGRGAAGAALVGVAVLAGQLSIGWCNDAVDAARDAAAGRTGKPVVDGTVSARTVRVAAVSALALCVPLSLASGPAAGAVHLAGVAAAWAYDLGVKATVLSWLPYAVGFGSLPAFVTLGLPGGPWPAWWAIPAAALLGCGAHLANVLPDIPADLVTGVRGWPQRLGAARVRLLVPLPLLAATALLVLGPGGSPGAGGWAALAAAGGLTAAGLVLGGRSPRVPFAAAVAVAAVDVVLLLAQGTALTAS